MRRTRLLATAGLVLGPLAVITACGSDDGTAVGAVPSSSASYSGAYVPLKGVAAAPRSVADLMAKAGCQGRVIDPQLYSREVGRCTLAGQEVTVATFDDNAKRDQWVSFGEGLGMTAKTGDRWAAGSIGAAGAETFATAIGA
ncbi:hypothetical protein [Pseudofrankia inefficax]|uniref:Lipoprotein n=1 Tax=Pseudofrankia inefficax (strain DSM 45817 / CECT 9037 / DDB 130130 / EuI1c) TaxID=298654 RepID=E3J704_PSEI1|nr:hypothetical protein [Pseudofrankia inefficax]ADP83224.1 hypothetical protein FraEuI1c_5236 [Pseudofrankia inefficax]